MSTKFGKKKSKQPNYFSHDFVISNHGDICSIVAMVFVGGLLFKPTTPIAAKFVLMQHNSTDIPTPDNRMLYYNGFFDICACFFYSIMLIVIHAIIQEYLLDKYSKRLSMTKARLSRFNNSAHIVIFMAFSVYFICHVLYSDGFIKGIGDLWEGYPHTPLSLWTKFFFILQISYWLHNFPELYFQKVKKDEIFVRITPSVLFLIAISVAYVINLTKLTLVLLLVQYSTDLVFHLARASGLALKTGLSTFSFKIWNAVFVPARVIIICLTFLTLQYGLARNSRTSVDRDLGNYNTSFVRFGVLLFVFFCQAWMMWNFVNYHLRKRRENAHQNKSSHGTKSVSQVHQKKKKIA